MVPLIPASSRRLQRNFAHRAALPCSAALHMRAKHVMPCPIIHGNSPERLAPCRHAHRHSGLHFLQVRLTRPAALTALCAPWRRIRADEVLRRRRVLRQHHGREPRRDRSSAADSRAQVRARSPVCLWAHSAARVVAEGACGDLLRCRCPLALAGEVSGSGGARTPRRHMQLSAAAAATRRAPGAPAAAAPHAGASAPGRREQHPAAGKAGACDRLGMLSGCRAAGASRPIALGARERYGRVCGAVCAEGSAGMFHGPVLRARVRSCADERAGGGLEALPALETRMAGTSGSGLRGMQVWARGSAVPRVCGGCPTAARSGT